MTGKIGGGHQKQGVGVAATPTLTKGGKKGGKTKRHVKDIQASGHPGPFTM